MIYATENPAKALWYATLPEIVRWDQGHRPPRQGKKGYEGLCTTLRGHETGFGKLSRAEIKARRSGFVYILPAETFKRSPDEVQQYDEFVTYDEVMPLKTIPVDRDDFPLPIIEINTAEEFRHFGHSMFVGFGNGDIRELDLPLPNSRKKLRIRIREMGVAEIKSILKENRGRRLSDIDWLNFAMVGFSFVDDVHGAKPDFKNKKLPISILLRRVHSDLIDAAYPCRESR